MKTVVFGPDNCACCPFSCEYNTSGMGLKSFCAFYHRLLQNDLMQKAEFCKVGEIVVKEKEQSNQFSNGTFPCEEFNLDR